ncbi:MAG: leucine-rich repeat domain-containing protein [Ruminococcaceae bacterium]|nr:leucine-rich repeat domain-containing protein [Oscillospiraceae bacterium]
MKKRLLLTMILAAVLCMLFAFAVNAEEYELVNDLGDPSWYTGNYALMTDKTSKVVLSNGDGTYTAYPAYYVLKYSITVKDGAITEAYVNGFDYSFVNEKTGKGYSTGAIYKVELPNGLTTVKNTYFGHNPKEPNVVELIMSDSMTSISAHAFRETTNLKKVVVSKNVTAIGSYAFYKAKGLEEVIFRGGSDAELDVSGDNIFLECTALKEIDLSSRKIITLGSSFLSKCSNLGKVTLPESLENVGYCSIFNNPKMYLASDFLPENLKTVGQHFLSGCVNINKVLFFPEGFEGFSASYNFSSDQSVPADITLVFLGKMEGKMDFYQASVSNGRKITLIFTKNQFSDLTGKFVTACDDGTIAYVGKTAPTDDNNYISQTGTLDLLLGNPTDANTKYKVNENGDTLYYVHNRTYSVYFCGGDKVELCHNVRSTNVESGYNNYITTPFTFDKQGHMDAGIHYDLIEIKSLPTCGDDGVTENTCVLCDRVAQDVAPATGDHELYEVSTCADKCEVCKKYVQKATQSHSCTEKLSYENGYLQAGTKLTYCENEGCEHQITEEIKALFTVLGYSVYEAGDGSVLQGFLINKEAISVYASQGISFEFGVVASTLEAPLDENGTPTDSKKVIKQSMANAYGDAFEIRVIGIKVSPNTPFIACGYVIDNGKVYYLDNGETVEKPTLQSYNQLMGIVG